MNNTTWKVMAKNDNLCKLWLGDDIDEICLADDYDAEDVVLTESPGRHKSRLFYFKVTLDQLSGKRRPMVGRRG